MSEPAYEYCASYCPGKILNCPHYKPQGVMRRCEVYELIEQTVAPERRRLLSRKALEDIVEQARKCL